MIRFIDLGDQILEGERQFAFWNTVPDMFLTYNGNQVWSTWIGFEADVIWHVGEERAQAIFERFEPLVPNWAKEVK